MAAKLNVVNKARKSPGTCRKCGKVIAVGESYVHFKFRYGSKQIAHNTPACRPTADERESNPKRAAHNRATGLVTLAKSATTPQDAAGFLREAMEAVEEIVGDLESSLSSWSGTNFEYGEMAESFQTTKDELNDWIANAEEWADDLEGMDEAPDEPGDEPVEPGSEPVRDDYPDGDDGQAEYDLARTDYEAAHDAYLGEYMEWEAATNAAEGYQESFQNTLDVIEDVPDLQF
jgi:predicted RNA-binding Zn-ribbon protein involved in translation (DUF1610 family)